MVSKTQARRKADIKSKLMAAIAMLLVSSIMMVSSTYAWFTLSTAPEVTGINTAVGANGNLEMALLPNGTAASEIKTTTSDGKQILVEKNKPWGNLVDLAPDSGVDYYGLSDITLYPSQLNVATWDDETAKLNPTAISTASFLEVPVYGADGRIKDMTGTQTGVFDADNSNQAFYPISNNADNNGVRAIGSASGLTPRQLALRNALAAGNTATSQAKTFASRSLSANGNALADIAMARALDNTAKFDADDVAALRAMINSLQGTETTDGVIDYLETAYMQYILVVAAADGVGDTAYSAVAGAVNAENATLASVTAMLTNNVTLPSAFTDAVTQFNGIVSAVAKADEALKEAEAALADGATELEWNDISGAVSPLIDSEAMTVNGMTIAAIKAEGGFDALQKTVLSQGGINLILGSGAGVYADIADQCGNFEAKLTISEITYGGLTITDVPATMKTNGITPSYLSAIGAAVGVLKAPAAGANDNMPITDVYGYIIDLAFRTNAASSNLLLQQEGVDRIYDDNNNEETMGNGSSMIFKATTVDFNDQQVKDLMGAIRIVFFNPADNNKVVATAKLDAANAELTGEGWKAYLYLYKMTESGEDKSADNTIMALTQNTAQALSVLVYLDGNVVENGDVAATGSTSMTGTLNLQFASSAELTPMEYADLHIEGGNADDETQATEYTVTLPEGVTGNAKATAGADYTFTVADTHNLGTVTVGGTEFTPTPGENGSYTIPAASVTGDIVITATAK